MVASTLNQFKFPLLPPRWADFVPVFKCFYMNAIENYRDVVNKHELRDKIGPTWELEGLE